MKKSIIAIITLFIAVVVTFGLNMSYANVTEGITITIKGATNAHSYEAYQVFKGNTSTTNNQLSEVEWGLGVNGNKILEELQKELCTTCNSAKDVANWLDRNENDIEEIDDEKAQSFAKIVGKSLSSNKFTSQFEDSTQKHKIEVDEDGYYFIKDVSNLASKNEAYTRYILRVLGGSNVNEINVKAELPTITKRILESTTEVESTVKEIGKKVTYKLTATLPNTLDDFSTYQLIFHDVMSKGLTYDENSYSIYLNNTSEEPVEITSYFKISKGINDDKVELIFTASNIKNIPKLTKDSTIVLTYIATVNSDAVSDENCNENEAYLVFSNDPNDTTGGNLGKTITDKTTVCTYELDIEKRDGKNKSTKLRGVGFKLCLDNNKNSCAKWTKNLEDVYILAGWGSFDDNNTEVFTDTSGIAKLRGLDSKTYYLFETTAYEGYNKLTEATTVNMSGATGSIKEIKVDNYKGTLFPSTGGIGTILIYLCGSTLIAGAIVLTIVNKKRTKKK